MTNNEIFLGQALKTNQPVKININQLTRHAAIFGASGSGKTGYLTSLIEQTLLAGVPVTVLDIKGDLARLLHQPNSLRDACERSLLTPGGSHGVPINIFGSFFGSEKKSEIVVTSLLKMMGLESSKMQDSYHLFLTEALKHSKTLEHVLQQVTSPSFRKLGHLPLNDAISTANRKSLATKLNSVLSHPSFNIWRQGITLDFKNFHNTEKPILNVISVAHLINDEEKAMAIHYVLEEYKQWALNQAGSSELRALLCLDEIRGLCPPHPRNPATKEPLMRLLKQARAFGVGLVLGTQNVKDIDYQAFGQCNTWLVGQLKTKIDRNRIIEGLSQSKLETTVIDKAIAGLSPRQFIAMTDSSIQTIKTPNCFTKLGGPLIIKDLENLVMEGWIKQHSVAKKGNWLSFFGGL